MAEGKIFDLKKNLYNQIKSSDDVSKLRQSLEKCERHSLLSWIDEDGYDILHHAIIGDNAEAVGMIFALGHFKYPHEPRHHSYIHLAANFGNRSIVVMLLQERPRDYSIKKSKFKYAQKPSEISLMSANGCDVVSPLDVAANCGHVGCVRTILDISSVKNRLEVCSDNHLSAACASNSPSALRLLLKQNSPSEEIKSAVGTALKLANAECLDVLLSCNPKLTSLFSGMNLYHVLFSYSMSFRKEWYESLLTVTSVLLKNDQNPVSAVPFRTYPLYSLLSHTPASDFDKTSPYIIACMLLLLNAGVDVNFDEVTFEQQHACSTIQTAFGRTAFASSLHCLYGNVRSLLKLFEDDVTNIRRFVTKATETLLRHGAELSVCGPIEDTDLVGNALMAFIQILIKLGLDERSMTTFRLLTQNGSDPNVNWNGRYSINIFINEILFNCDTFEEFYKHVETTSMEFAKEVINTLLMNMTQDALSSASKVEFEGKPTNIVQRKMFKVCKDELSKRSGQIQSLKLKCRICVLAACGWKSTKVAELPLPLAMKKYINAVD